MTGSRKGTEGTKGTERNRKELKEPKGTCTCTRVCVFSVVFSAVAVPPERLGVDQRRLRQNLHPRLHLPGRVTAEVVGPHVGVAGLEDGGMEGWRGKGKVGGIDGGRDGSRERARKGWMDEEGEGA